MENDFNLELSEIKRQRLLNNNNKINTGQNKFDFEENKININSRNFLFDKKSFQRKYNDLLLNSKKNVQIKPILKNFPKFNDNKYSINKSTFRDNQNSLDEITKDKSDKKIPNLSRNLSVLKKLNKQEKCFDFNKYLIKNKSTSYILNKSNQILPLIKPRKILINICSGPFEFKITDINKRNYSFKKFGKNSFFMGERYNPDNYAIKEKIKVGRNQYGALYSN